LWLVLADAGKLARLSNFRGFGDQRRWLLHQENLENCSTRDGANDLPGSSRIELFIGSSFRSLRGAGVKPSARGRSGTTAKALTQNTLFIR
jgi:hypothetical protein